MTFVLGQIVKFEGIEEPCVVYEVLDPKEVWLYCPQLKQECFCVKLSVIGFVPVKVLSPARSVVGNVSAIDVALQISNQLN